MKGLLSLLTVLTVHTGCTLAQPVTVSEQQVNADISFQAVTISGVRVWASGTHGSLYRSEDQGLNWQQVTPPADSAALQFRDVAITGPTSAVIMAAGEGADSRIYVTHDNGEHWQLTLQGQQKATFFDCIDFTSAESGMLYGDSDNNQLFLKQTNDGGITWQDVPTGITALDSEGGFASSGTCLNHGYDSNNRIVGTGNGADARLLVQKNDQWEAIKSALPGGEATGIFSVQMRKDRIYAFGGTLKSDQQPALAFQYDTQQRRWKALPKVPFNGAIYGSAITSNAIYISSPSGVAVLADGDTDWQTISDKNIWSVSCANNDYCIGVGKQGRIVRWETDAMATNTVTRRDVPLYDGTIPGEISADNKEYLAEGAADDPFLVAVSKPALTAFFPAPEKRNGTAVIICPGGGYFGLAIRKEGYDVAQRLAEQGITAFVLKYRMPSQDTMDEPSYGPLQDAQQAISQVRKNAQAWGLFANKVGIMGFSAGGHLAATAATHYRHAVSAQTEKYNLRPDFQILVYPVISMTSAITHQGSRELLLGTNPDDQRVATFSNEKQVDENTPQAFIIHANDDTVVPVANALDYYSALVEQHVPVQLELLPEGGHGYGMRMPYDWFNAMTNWMQARNLVP